MQKCRVQVSCPMLAVSPLWQTVVQVLPWAEQKQRRQDMQAAWKAQRLPYIQECQEAVLKKPAQGERIQPESMQQKQVQQAVSNPTARERAAVCPVAVCPALFPVQKIHMERKECPQAECRPLLLRRRVQPQGLMCSPARQPRPGTWA